jgi:hypothetical protein
MSGTEKELKKKLQLVEQFKRPKLIIFTKLINRW